MTLYSAILTERSVPYHMSFGGVLIHSDSPSSVVLRISRYMHTCHFPRRHRVSRITAVLFMFPLMFP